MKRNYVWSLVSLLLLATTSLAQTNLPKEEYKLSASATTITLAKGQQDSVKILLLRSRSFKTGNASVTLNPLTEAGLSLTIKQLSQPDEYMVYMAAAADARAGEYNIVPTCTLRNKTKGIILKLIVK